MGSSHAKQLPDSAQSESQFSHISQDSNNNKKALSSRSIRLMPKSLSRLKKMPFSGRVNAKASQLPVGSSYPYPRGHSTLLIPNNGSKATIASSPNSMPSPLNIYCSKSGPDALLSHRKEMKKSQETRSTPFVKRFLRPGSKADVPSPVYSCSEEHSSATSGPGSFSLLPQSNAQDLILALNNSNVSQNLMRPENHVVLHNANEIPENHMPQHANESAASRCFKTPPNNKLKWNISITGSCSSSKPSTIPVLKFGKWRNEPETPQKSFLSMKTGENNQDFIFDGKTPTSSSKLPVMKGSSLKKEANKVARNGALAMEKPAVFAQPAPTRPNNFSTPLHFVKPPASWPGASTSSCFSKQANSKANGNFAAMKTSKSLGMAPLAESECFVIENSPAIEMAPKVPSGKNQRKASQDKKALKSPNKKPPGLPIPKRRGNPMEQRLKNLANYSATRTKIYGSLETQQPKTESQDQNKHLRVSVDQNANPVVNEIFYVKDKLIDQDRIPHITIPTIIDKNDTQNQNLIDQNLNFTKCETLLDPAISNLIFDDETLLDSSKTNMVDSGVKFPIDDYDGAMENNDTSDEDDESNSCCHKLMSSPDDSSSCGFLRGAIDDEIDDQPQLSVHDFLGVMSVEQTPTEERCNLFAATSTSNNCWNLQPPRDYDFTTNQYNHYDEHENIIDDEKYHRHNNEEEDREFFAQNYEASHFSSIQSQKSSQLSATSSIEGSNDNNTVPFAFMNITEKANHVQHTMIRSSCEESCSDDLEDETMLAIDPQTYRHMAQDVTVVKTLLFRLKRVLQETEAANGVLSSGKNGIIKDCHDDIMALNDGFTTEDLKEENSALRTQVALMRHDLESRDAIIQRQKMEIEKLQEQMNSLSMSYGSIENNSANVEKKILPKDDNSS